MLKDFRPVLGILLRFIIIYLVLLFAYQFYLNSFKAQGLDPYSHFIAEQVKMIQNKMGYTTELYHDIPDERVWFNVKQEYVSIMVEGCNAVSVIILFISFVFAFYKGNKTFVFAIAGIVVLYLMNIFRIAGINILTRDYPQYNKMAHDYLFPAVIYGTVVILWLIWIQFFALKNENS